MCLPVIHKNAFAIATCKQLVVQAKYLLFSHLSSSNLHLPLAIRQLDRLLIALRNKPAISHSPQQRRRRRHALPQRQSIALARNMQEQHGSIFNPAIAHLLVPPREPSKTVKVNVIAQVMSGIVRLLSRHKRWRPRCFTLAQVPLPAGEDFVVLQRRRQDVLAVREIRVAGVGREPLAVDVGVLAVAVAVRESLQRVVRAAGRHAEVQDQVYGVDVGG